MTFNEWYFENKNVLENADVARLRSLWFLLEENGLSDEEIAHVITGIIEAVIGQ